MWFLRLLRHPAMAICVFGHAFVVLVWALACWSWETTQSVELGIVGFLLSLILLFLDLPVVLIASWVDLDIFSALDDLFWSSVRVLVFGSIEWGIIGFLLAFPDLLDRRDPHGISHV